MESIIEEIEPDLILKDGKIFDRWMMAWDT